MNACPWCGLVGGFHDDKVHSRIVIPRENILAKGWQHEPSRQDPPTVDVWPGPGKRVNTMDMTVEDIPEEG